MKNIKDLGKQAMPMARQAVIDCVPEYCIGGCPKCGDYVMEKGNNAECMYCEFSEPLVEWNKRD